MSQPIYGDPRSPRALPRVEALEERQVLSSTSLLPRPNLGTAVLRPLPEAEENDSRGQSREENEGQERSGKMSSLDSRRDREEDRDSGDGRSGEGGGSQQGRTQEQTDAVFSSPSTSFQDATSSSSQLPPLTDSERRDEKEDNRSDRSGETSSFDSRREDDSSDSDGVANDSSQAESDFDRDRSGEGRSDGRVDVDSGDLSGGASQSGDFSERSRFEEDRADDDRRSEDPENRLFGDESDSGRDRPDDRQFDHDRFDGGSADPSGDERRSDDFSERNSFEDDSAEGRSESGAGDRLFGDDGGDDRNFREREVDAVFGDPRISFQDPTGPSPLPPLANNVTEVTEEGREQGSESLAVPTSIGGDASPVFEDYRIARDALLAGTTPVSLPNANLTSALVPGTDSIYGPKSVVTDGQARGDSLVGPEEEALGERARAEDSERSESEQETDGLDMRADSSRMTTRSRSSLAGASDERRPLSAGDRRGDDRSALPGFVAETGLKAAEMPMMGSSANEEATADGQQAGSDKNEVSSGGDARCEQPEVAPEVSTAGHLASEPLPSGMVFDVQGLAANLEDFLRQVDSVGEQFGVPSVGAGLSPWLTAAALAVAACEIARRQLCHTARLSEALVGAEMSPWSLTPEHGPSKPCL